MMSSMFSLFSLQILDILDLEVLNFVYLNNWLFWSGFWIDVSHIQDFMYIIV